MEHLFVLSADAGRLRLPSASQASRPNDREKDIFERHGKAVELHVSTIRSRVHGARLATKSWHPANPAEVPREDVSVPVYLTHGLLGYKEEFDPFGQEIANATGRVVIAFDARNHGESEHVERMDYISMGDDLAGYMSENGVQKAIFISHSMGAGTSLVLAIRKPSLVHALMLIDVAVVNAPRVRQLVAFLQMMRGIRFQPGSSLEDNRQMAAKIMGIFETEDFLIERTLPNIVEKDGIVQWRVDISVLIRDIYNLTQIPAGFLAEKLEYKRPLCILQAGLSGYITPEGRQQTKELLPQTQFQEFPAANHWVHLDSPDLFLDAAIKFINSVN